MLIGAIHQINRNKTPSFSTCTVRKPHAPCSIFARKCQCNEFQVSNPLKYMYIVSNFKHTTWAGIYISIRNYDPLLEALPFPRVFKCVPFSFSLFFKVMNESEAIIWLWTVDWTRCNASSTPDTESFQPLPPYRTCVRQLLRERESVLRVCYLRNKQKSSSLKSHL